jgi:hypothetical protein
LSDGKFGVPEEAEVFKDKQLMSIGVGNECIFGATDAKPSVLVFANLDGVAVEDELIGDLVLPLTRTNVSVTSGNDWCLTPADGKDGNLVFIVKKIRGRFAKGFVGKFNKNQPPLAVAASGLCHFVLYMDDGTKKLGFSEFDKVTGKTKWGQVELKHGYFPWFLQIHFTIILT